MRANNVCAGCIALLTLYVAISSLRRDGGMFLLCVMKAWVRVMKKKIGKQVGEGMT